jgi:signal transduction histidine kinase
LFRADTARQRHTSSQGSGHGQHGSGLGLAIVRAIVQAHQGSIHACHSAMGGVQMVVVLPLNHHETYTKEPHEVDPSNAVTVPQTLE